MAVQLRGDVQRDELPIVQGPFPRDPIDDLIVDADAARGGIAVGQDRARASTRRREHLSGKLV